MKKSKFYTGILATIIASSLSGCAKKVDYDISPKHIHMYTSESGLNRLILGEKEYVDSYYWSESYVPKTDENTLVAKEGLLSTKSNIEFVLTSLEHIPDNCRKEYVKEWVYGPHYGYGYCYHFDGEKYTWGYGYGQITEYHWEDTWKRIDEDKYTPNKVKDIYYVIKLYKIDENGELTYQYFNSFDEVEEGYIYFEEGKLIVEVESEEYYLNPNDLQNQNKELTR